MSTEAQAIADLAVKHRQPIILKTEDGREFLIRPSDTSMQDVSEPNAAPVYLPDHIAQAVTLQTVDSLVEYANRFKTDNTVLFADIDTNSLVAAIDYHAPDSPAHVSHTAKLTLPHSVEFKTWAHASGKLVGQLEFARFLEENAADVAAPSGADLLEACRDLHAIRKVNFKKAVRTATDNENFEFTDETEARTSGGVEVPTKFLLKIPVYFGGETTELYAFLRWRLDDGALNLGIVLHRAEHVRQAVFKQIVMDAAHRTSLPAVFGEIAH
jgi:uncharacterized protein YfdQ (DUF2303 family)